MPAAVEEKSMVPTIVVGIGGTGHEILARVRRLVEETYGSLKNFPILSFLIIDTDKDYKISNPEAGGSPFKDNEKHWARVSGKQVREMVAEMDKFPWINSWFPSELERNITSLEAGAGQIRACGRFAFFCNYHEIQKKFLDAVRRVKGRETYMLNRYGIRVSNNAVNVFVTGSLSGGTGSGMLIDMGYCIRNWLRGEGSPMTTALVPSPEAFAGINVGDRVLSNGYAALMELNYYSDHRTEYVHQYSAGLVDEVRSQLPPFDFTYLVGTKNGESDFKLEQIREMIAQNIFLDMTSDFAPHKRSIRDNIKGAWAQADPGGRGYPKQFMSFGLSTLEIPIAQIRTSLSYRLAQDLVNWWLNDGAILPAQMLELVRDNTLKKMRLTEGELVMDLAAAEDKSILALISEWINSLRQEIIREDWLQCTHQGVNMLGAERGKIVRFVDEYLMPKVDNYRNDHCLEMSPDERLHGDYFKKIYNNRDHLIQQGRKALETELYNILEDRTRGPKYADAFIVTVRQVFDTQTEKFRRDLAKVWSQNESNRQKQYEKSLADIQEFKDKFGITKQDKMEQYCAEALTGLEGSLIATMQRKVRATGLEVITRLQEYLTQLERRYNRFKQKLIQARDLFALKAQQQADSADALLINGIKLYDRQELNVLYQDLMVQFAGGRGGAKSEYEIGLDALCSTMSEDVLKSASPLWKESRLVDEIMRLFDITEIPDVRDDDFQEIISDRTKKVIIKAPENSKMKRELAACDRILKIYPDDTDIINNIRIAYQKSSPLVMLNKAVLQGEDAGFTPARNINVAILGGRNTSDLAAQKILPKLQEFIGNEDDIKPLGETERHRVVFVQEIGGFSLRCLDGMRDLRQSYQDWKGESIVAKRAQQAGESRDLPIPVHIQKEPPFWDVFPEDPTIFKLVVEARALKVLHQDINRATNEHTIRYQIKTATGVKPVDLAANWEEVIQVLDVKACRRDREEIQGQVTTKLTNTKTPAQKQALYAELLLYLKQRAEDLQARGGEESPEYKREDKIILELITNQQLNTEVMEMPLVSRPPEIPIQPQPTPAVSVAATDTVFCTHCGHKNPIKSNFCARCGTKLVKPTYKR
jgi:ribosomal protein L40E